MSKRPPPGGRSANPAYDAAQATAQAVPEGQLQPAPTAAMHADPVGHAASFVHGSPVHSNVSAQRDPPPTR